MDNQKARLSVLRRITLWDRHFVGLIPNERWQLCRAVPRQNRYKWILSPKVLPRNFKCHYSIGQKALQCDHGEETHFRNWSRSTDSLIQIWNRHKQHPNKVNHNMNYFTGSALSRSHGWDCKWSKTSGLTHPNLESRFRPYKSQQDIGSSRYIASPLARCVQPEPLRSMHWRDMDLQVVRTLRTHSSKFGK